MKGGHDVGGPRPRLGDPLVNTGIVERAVIEKSVNDAYASRTFGETLTRQGIVEPIDIYRAFAMQWHLPFALAR